MVGIFLTRDMARQLNVFLIWFCIGGCFAGVVTRNFKQNDIFRIAEELSEVEIPVPSSTQKMHENDTLGKAEELNSLKLPSFNSSGLSILNDTKNSSELDSRSSISANSPPESLIFPGNASKESDISNKLSVDLDQPEKGNMDGMKSDGSNDSTLTHEPSETTSTLTHVEGASDDIADIGIIGDTSSFGDVSNQTSGLNETDTRVEEFKVRLNGSDSTASSLPRNNAESNHDVNFSGDITDGVEEINGSLGSNIDVENVESGISGELENLADVNASEGIFSNFGLEFFRNSEVAKNAAKAMEVFNFTDSLTDHIIEENEFHSFLDVVTPTPEKSDDSDSAQITVVQELFNSSDVNLNGTENVKGVEMFEDKNNSTSNVTELVEIEKETSEFLNSTESENVDEPLKLTNFTEPLRDMNETLISNMSTITNETDFAEFGNETLDTEPESVTESLEITNFTEPMEKKNETLVSNISTLTNETNFTEVPLTEVDSKNSTNVPKCPPPGICLFWFLSQDACAVNSHCLGSRICCRIRCSKTCIEV